METIQFNYTENFGFIRDPKQVEGQESQVLFIANSTGRQLQAGWSTIKQHGILFDIKSSERETKLIADISMSNTLMVSMARNEFGWDIGKMFRINVLDILSIKESSEALRITFKLQSGNTYNYPILDIFPLLSV
jgi:hypothetical protein